MDFCRDHLNPWHPGDTPRMALYHETLPPWKCVEQEKRSNKALTMADQAVIKLHSIIQIGNWSFIYVINSDGFQIWGYNSSFHEAIRLLCNGSQKGVNWILGSVKKETKTKTPLCIPWQNILNIINFGSPCPQNNRIENRKYRASWQKWAKTLNSLALDSKAPQPRLRKNFDRSL